MLTVTSSNAPFWHQSSRASSNGNGPAAGGDVLHVHLRHTADGQRPRRASESETTSNYFKLLSNYFKHISKIFLYQTQHSRMKDESGAQSARTTNGSIDSLSPGRIYGTISLDTGTNWRRLVPPPHFPTLWLAGIHVSRVSV